MGDVEGCFGECASVKQHAGPERGNARGYKMTPAGLDPAIPGSVGRCLIHWATGPVAYLYLPLVMLTFLIKLGGRAARSASHPVATQNQGRPGQGWGRTGRGKCLPGHGRGRPGLGKARPGPGKGRPEKRKAP